MEPSHHEEPRVEIMGVRLASFVGLDLAFVDCVSIPAGISLKIGSVHSAACLPVYLVNLTRCACPYNWLWFSKVGEFRYKPRRSEVFSQHYPTG
jgi:hypothetical protein